MWIKFQHRGTSFFVVQHGGKVRGRQGRKEPTKERPALSDDIQAWQEHGLGARAYPSQTHRLITPNGKHT